eukprot:1661976-Amphidinium_carterae.1
MKDMTQRDNESHQNCNQITTDLINTDISNNNDPKEHELPTGTPPQTSKVAGNLNAKVKTPKLHEQPSLKTKPYLTNIIRQMFDLTNSHSSLTLIAQKATICKQSMLTNS